MQIYDPVANTWTTASSLPSPLFGFTTAGVNGKLYILGMTVDMGGGGASILVKEYNPATDTFATKASMPTAEAYASIAVVNNLIYVTGGQGTGGSRSGATAVFDPIANS